MAQMHKINKDGIQSHWAHMLQDDIGARAHFYIAGNTLRGPTYLSHT